MVMDDPHDLGAEECEPLDESSDLVVPPAQGEEPAALRVSMVQSPVLNTFYHEHPVQLTLDTGATSNMVRTSSAKLYGFPITPASQMAGQADGVTPMDVIGKVHCSLTRGQRTLELDALVICHLDIDILAGDPFMVRNDIGVRPAKRQIACLGVGGGRGKEERACNDVSGIFISALNFSTQNADWWILNLVLTSLLFACVVLTTQKLVAEFLFVKVARISLNN